MRSARILAAAAAPFAACAAAHADDCQQAWDVSFASPGGAGGIVTSSLVADVGQGPSLYIGGFFTTVAGQSISRIARFSAGQWHAVGPGFSKNIFALCAHDFGDGPRLYAGGQVSSAGGFPARLVAQWDGAQWSPMSFGLTPSTGVVLALAVFQGDLYAGGQFSGADGQPAANIARWDGQAWTPVGAGLNGAVLALEVFEDENGASLYAGGQFTNTADTGIQDTAMTRVGRWDGAQWHAAGDGADDSVYALRAATVGGETALYAGGDFLNAGGQPAVRIAKYSNGVWSALEGGFNATVRAIEPFEDADGAAVAVGGFFTQANAETHMRVARWDGAWSPMGSGLSTGNSPSARTVRDVDLDGERYLFVGGVFGLAGGVSTTNVARWFVCPQSTAPEDLNGDGAVNGTDLGLLLLAWGPCPAPCPEDLNSDGVVDGSDLGLLLLAWSN